jgi:hypothetical protein
MYSVTYHSSSSEVDAVPASKTGWGSSLRTFVSAALIPFAAGLLVLIGYLLLGNFFGGFLGAVGAVFALVWWHSLHGKMFPARIPAGSIIALAAVSAGLFALTLALS